MFRIGILPFEEKRECAKYSLVWKKKKYQMQSSPLPRRSNNNNNHNHYNNRSFRIATHNCEFIYCRFAGH